MMYNIMHKKIINKDEFLIPKNPPNNLKILKQTLGFTDAQLAEMLNIEPSYLSSVLNNRATFSGSVTLKLLQKLNVSFSFIYDIQKSITLPCKNVSDCMIVVGSTNEITNMYQVIGSIFKEYDESEDNASIIYYSKLKIKNNKFILSSNNDMPFNLDLKTMKLYKNELEGLDMEYIDENRYYYFIGAEIRNIDDRTISIDTYKALDLETLSLLEKLPFKKVKEITMLNTSYKTNGTSIILDKPINRVSKLGIEEVKELKENEYIKLQDKAIVVSSLSEEETINKLKLYRLIKNYSHADMAKIFGISRESYRLLELGHNKLTTHSMWIIENKLGILLESIINIDMYCKKFNIL